MNRPFVHMLNWPVPLAPALCAGKALEAAGEQPRLSKQDRLRCRDVRRSGLGRVRSCPLLTICVWCFAWPLQ